MRPHLQPTAPIATEAILTGDPKRAMELAVALTERPLMSNLARGLWGYHGATPAGRELSVHSTGIGGPSTALVLRELHGHGVRRAIRIGTAHALGPEPALGEARAVSAALGLDGASRTLGGLTRESEPGTLGIEALSDPGIAERLESSLGAPATRVASLDVPVDLDHEGVGAAADFEAPLVDLSTAAFLIQAASLGMEAAAIVVSASGPAGELAAEELDAACLTAGMRALDALAGAAATEPS